MIKSFLALALGILGAAAAAAEPKPNVVFILVDDLRQDTLGATGSPVARTPHLDRLAREGANFTNAFVTTPLCSPSRASFLTGRYVHSHGIDGNSGADAGHGLESFPKRLQPAGYETGYVGKWHMGNDATPRPGFDFWAGLKGQSVHFDPPVNVNGREIVEKGYTTDVLTSYAVSFVRQPRSKPFALYLSHKSVHGPFKPAPRHKDLYTTETLPEPPSLSDDLAGKPALSRRLANPGNDLVQKRNPEIARNQLRMLQAVDEGVGEVLRALEETGQLENTLVIFTSDNGYQWGEHRLGDKRTAYEESVRVPLLMRWPKGIPAGAKPDGLALNVDIAPTLLELAGSAIPADVQGRSLVPLFRGAQGEGRKSALLEYFAEERFPRVPSWQAVRTGDGWKYIRYEFEGMDELYDLNSDPYEMRNLIARPDAQARLAGLKKDLDGLLKETGGALLKQREWKASDAEAGTGAAADEGDRKRKASRKKKPRSQARPDGPPNVVLIFADDLGYADVGALGNTRFKTPHLDSMASQGVTLTQFYVPSPSCTPSRAALLTGRFPLRVGLPRVLHPKDKVGMPAEEVTLAEALKERGYATAAVGKWHLGHLPQFLPTRHGFDSWFGIPYSNDMYSEKRTDPPVPLMRGTEIVEQPAEQKTLTRRYTEEALGFIRRNADRPFFLYLPHTFPHVPLHCSDEFAGKSGAGLYGDVVQELDWSVGEILKELKTQRLDRNTLVIFTSDNGPWLIKKSHGGSAGDLRDGKGTVYEGGVRVPFFARWPGRIPAGTRSDEAAISTDLFPTLVKAAGAKLPAGRALDGTDVMNVLTGKGPRKPMDMFFSRGSSIRAVRSGDWKLVLDDPATTAPTELFDMAADPRELRNLAEARPEILRELQEKARTMGAEFEAEKAARDPEDALSL